jgi:hypothetical protein
MNTYEFSNEEVKLLQDAIQTYSERCAAQYNEFSEERIRKAGRLYKILSCNPFVDLSVSKLDYVCDY